MSPKIPFFLLLSSTLSFAASNGYNGAVTYGGRRPVALAKSFEQPMQRILDSLKARGYQPRDVGCFGYRPNNASAHPSGHACDVDQTGRDITRVNRFISRKDQIQLAVAAGAVSGCKWRHPDCGHFEAKSAPYSPAGTRVGAHRYPEYENHPVKRRSGTRQVSSQRRRRSRGYQQSYYQDTYYSNNSWIPWFQPNYGGY